MELGAARLVVPSKGPVLETMIPRRVRPDYLERMPDEPLSKSVDTWTRDDLDLLIGRVETEYLELKGSDTDIGGSGRGAVAKEIAA